MTTALQHGTVIGGRYHLDRLLGEGGMGAVWSATHSITGGRVALKFIKAAANDPDGEMKRRFLREARSAALVEHPNVVSIRDVLEHEDAPVIVMDLLLGETLAQRLAREGTLGVGEAARIVLSVIGAVGAAHEVGLIHRDLKPENIFLAKTHHGEVVRVLDFGIAKLVRPGVDGTASAVTQSGAVIGTPAYMAPEQLFGERDLDYRVDVWALGVILYEVLVGERPVDGDNYGQIAKRLLSNALPSLAKKRPDVPGDLSSLVDRMLARERNDRVGDLREAADVLALHTSHARPSFGAPRSRPLTDSDTERKVVYGSMQPPADDPFAAGSRRADPNAATMQSEPRRADANAATLEAPSSPKHETGLAHVAAVRVPSRSYTPWIVAAIGLCTVGAVAALRLFPAGVARDSGTSVSQPIPVPATPTPVPAQPTISTLPPTPDALAAVPSAAPSASETTSATATPTKSTAKPVKGAASATASVSATVAQPTPTPAPTPVAPTPTVSATTMGGSGLVTKPPF